MQYSVALATRHHGVGDYRASLSVMEVRNLLPHGFDFAADTLLPRGHKVPFGCSADAPASNRLRARGGFKAVKRVMAARLRLLP